MIIIIIFIICILFFYVNFKIYNKLIKIKYIKCFVKGLYIYYNKLGYIKNNYNKLGYIKNNYFKLVVFKARQIMLIID